MAKVTSKLQVTVPKAIAEQYEIKPGAEIEWVAAGEVIRVIPHVISRAPDRASRLRWFDQATERQRRRAKPAIRPTGRNRGWKREDLYTRGRSG